MSDKIKEFFPFDEYREYQRDTIVRILKAFGNGKKSVLLEAPVGSGKSPIAIAIARAMNTAYYLTTQKILQSQLINDFGRFDGIEDIKGRNSYSCWFLRDHLKTSSDATCDKGMCVKKGKGKLDICKSHCPYNLQLSKCEAAPISIFNFSSYLFQKHMSNKFREQRKLMIIDEAHNIESQIMNFVELKINGRDIDTSIPNLNSVGEYVRFFDDMGLDDILMDRLNDARDDLKSIVGDDEELSNLYDEETAPIISEIKKIESLLSRYNMMVKYSEEIECISEYDKNSVIIKPLYARYHTPRMLLNGGRYNLMMSATILNPQIFGSNIGLDMSQTEFIKVPHTFPVQNRLIHLQYAGPMNYKNRKETTPKLIKKIDELLNKHDGERGIIHCHSFAMMKDIKNGLSRKNKKRLITQDDIKDRDELLMWHREHEGSIIVAPCFHEGVSLSDDDSRVQILTVVPWPSPQGNKQMEIRMKNDHRYYCWLAANKLIQSTGRSVRSKDDYCSTYILDSNFDKFFGMTDSIGLMPDWFVESLVVD